MTEFLGLLGMVVFIVLVIGFAAAVTWAVVKLNPAKKPDAQPPAT